MMDENDLFLIASELRAKGTAMGFAQLEQSLVITALGEIAQKIGEKLKANRVSKETIQEAWDQR